MQGHTGLVNGVAFFNDGRQLVTASWDKTLRIWDVQNGTLVGEPFEGHQSSVYSVAVSPDDKRIASGGMDETVIIWDVNSRQMVFDPLVKHTHWVNCVCFSPDGKRFASGSTDSTVVVWDSETAAVLTTLGHHYLAVQCVAFSPDGLKLAYVSSDCTIRVCRTDNADLILEIDAHRDQYWVRSVVWSRDGEQLISASEDKTVQFWDASAGYQIGQPCIGHSHWICSLVLSSNGSFIATSSHDETVRLWSTTTHNQMGQALEHTNQVYCVALSPDGALLASGGRDREVRLWSICDMLKQHDEQEERDMQENVDGMGDEDEQNQLVEIFEVPATPTEIREEKDRTEDGGEEDANLLGVGHALTRLRVASPSLIVRPPSRIRLVSELRDLL
ncbi:WD40 repeat-like protein [Rhizopogon salebrosus TDB-379]|nr:WD40 repeat-like protein [Rhizopogon salebrosus TDB-379]